MLIWVKHKGDSNKYCLAETIVPNIVIFTGIHYLNNGVRFQFYRSTQNLPLLFSLLYELMLEYRTNCVLRQMEQGEILSQAKSIRVGAANPKQTRLFIIRDLRPSIWLNYSHTGSASFTQRPQPFRPLLLVGIKNWKLNRCCETNLPAHFQKTCPSLCCAALSVRDEGWK